MKRVNEYFFGSEAHWTDYAWFYGSITFIIWVAVYTFLKVY